VTDINVSDPIIPFKETVMKQMAIGKNASQAIATVLSYSHSHNLLLQPPISRSTKLAQCFTADKFTSISILAEPIPNEIYSFISSQQFKDLVPKMGTSMT
jgi:hypothetical protein